MFIIVDGIDGCGKGTIVSALAERQRRAGAHVFDLRMFAQREHRLPEIQELDGVDVIVSCEPTYAWVGRTIRDELIRDNDRTYDALRTAEAFALDRLILYRRVILPARERGLAVIQERSVTSSLAYQPVQSNDELSVEQLAALEGNAFALAHPPDSCILITVDPARAMQRLQLRAEKHDAAIFERLPILERLHERYRSHSFRDLLHRYGWRTDDLDANGAVEDAVVRAQVVWDRAVHREISQPIL